MSFVVLALILFAFVAVAVIVDDVLSSSRPRQLGGADGAAPYPTTARCRVAGRHRLVADMPRDKVAVDIYEIGAEHPAMGSNNTMRAGTGRDPRGGCDTWAAARRLRGRHPR
jgi:hypothetical protein